MTMLCLCCEAHINEESRIPAARNYCQVCVSNDCWARLNEFGRKPRCYWRVIV